jgi:hypothetical protein
MGYVVRDFNTENNETGDITIYLCKNNKLYITIMNLHDMGQAWMYVKYSSNINLYDMYISILNTLTHDIYKQLLGKKNDKEFIIWEYKDIVCLNSEIENSKCSVYFDNYITFTRESVDLLEKWDNEEEDDEKYYIIHGEYLENGEFIYNKPILSNDYYEEI